MPDLLLRGAEVVWVSLWTLILEADIQGGDNDLLPKVCLVRAAISGCPSDGGGPGISIMLFQFCLIIA